MWLLLLPVKFQASADSFDRVMTLSFGVHFISGHSVDDILPASISVTEEGHLLVSTKSTFDDFSFVTTYDVDGRCIQSIPIRQSISYAVKSKETGIFVKCFTCRTETCNTMHEVSPNGVISHSYGPHFREYFECDGMTVGEGDQIFVIDKANGGRILVFGSRARLIGELLSKDDHQITKITGLSYIKDKKQLVVVGSDQIKIYQLNKNKELQVDFPVRQATLNVKDIKSSSKEGDSDHLFCARIDERKVRALEQFGDNLYLLYKSSLAVFPKNYLVRKAKFQNEALEIQIPNDRSLCDSCDGLWDVAASEIDLCLYVTDRRNNCVWSVTIDHKITKSVTDIGSPYTLSVTKNGSLCILSNDYKSLEIYDRSGKKVISPRLPRYMKYLLHAVETPKGTYIISWTRERQEVDDEEEEEKEEEEEEELEEEELEEEAQEQEKVLCKKRRKNCICSGDSGNNERALVCEISSDGSVLRSFRADNPQPNQMVTSNSKCIFQLD